MKHYMTSSFVYPDGSQVTVFPQIYGPFGSLADVLADASRRFPNDKKTKVFVLEGEWRNIPSSSLEKPESEKREPGNEANWSKQPDGQWSCNTCGARIMAGAVAHPIHDGPFPGSGSGECQYETVGYCPNCEKEPKFHGSPVTPP